MTNTEFQIKNKAGITQQIKIVWSIEDVFATVENMNEGNDEKISLTEEQAGEVLDRVLHDHDATMGVTWETLEYQIDNVIN